MAAEFFLWAKFVDCKKMQKIGVVNETCFNFAKEYDMDTNARNNRSKSDKLIKDCLLSCLSAAESNENIDFAKLTESDIEKERLAHCQYVL